MSVDLLPELKPSDTRNKSHPPPRWLIVLSIGFVLLIIVGTASGLFVFQNVLRPGQQQRVITLLPFMKSFLPYQPSGNTYIPTVEAAHPSAFSPDELLNLPLEIIASPTKTNPPFATTTPTQTATIAPSQTALSTMLPTATDVPSLPTAIMALADLLPSAARIYGLRGVVQTWNNCGPATITMGLSYFGWTEDQSFAAATLKPDEEDKNVTPLEMVQFVNEQTSIRAVTRMGGTLDLLKAFIAGGFPVIVSIGYTPEGEDWLGHYRAVVGYDDVQQRFYAYDSYLGTGGNGEGLSISYTEFDTGWQSFNRRYIVLYQQEDEPQVASILGDRSDIGRAAELALERAQRDAQADPRNGFAWFNVGTSLVAMERYAEAAVAYDRARQLNLPWRMLWYQFGPYEAYFNVGRYDDVTAMVSANLNNGGAYVEETYYWQGRVFAVRGDSSNARAAFNRALQANSLYVDAQAALVALDEDS